MSSTLPHISLLSTALAMARPASPGWRNGMWVSRGMKKSHGPISGTMGGREPMRKIHHSKPESPTICSHSSLWLE